MSSSTFRNRRGVEVKLATVTATEAKNEFGRVLETAITDGAVAITRHDATRAVLVSIDEFDALVAGAGAQLDVLSADFDALLATMQSPRARRGMKAAFAASPIALGRSARKAAARKRAK